MRHRVRLYLRLWWLQSKEFHFKYKWYLYPTLIFFLVLTVAFWPEDTVVFKSPLSITSLYVCQDFSYGTAEASNCNHVFEQGLPGVVAVYEVDLLEETDKLLQISWKRDGTHLGTTENPFEQNGAKVQPGRYILASPTNFPLEKGRYTVELSVSDYFLSAMDFVVQ